MGGFTAARPPPRNATLLTPFRLATAPFRRATRTPTDRARRWEWRICPARRPARWPAAQPAVCKGQSAVKSSRQSDGASQPVKLYRRQSARRRQSTMQIISTAVSPSNHLDGSSTAVSPSNHLDGSSAPVNHANHLAARSAPVGLPNHRRPASQSPKSSRRPPGASQPVKSSRRQLDASQPRKSSRRQSATQMMTSHGRPSK
jgi:hypothetical protein